MHSIMEFSIHILPPPSLSSSPSPPPPSSPSQLYDFFSYLARFNLTFPTAPYWDGVSVVGAVATGSHGSTLQFKVRKLARIFLLHTV